MVASLLVDDELLEGDVVLEMAKRGISALGSLGCGEGDVIAVMLRNDPAYLVAMLMCRLGGFYACPINWHFKADETGYVLSDCGARVLIVHADLLHQIEGAIPTGVTLIVVEPSAALRRSFALDPDSCRLPTKVLEWQSWLARHEPHAGPVRQPRTTLPYSSGTTGRPKGIKRQPLSAEHASRKGVIGASAMFFGRSAAEAERVFVTEGADRDVWGTKNLRRAIKAAGVALWSWNVDTDRLALDDPACDLWGVERSGDVTFDRLRCNTRDFRGLRNRLSDHGG